MLGLRDIPLLAQGLLESMMCWRSEGPGWGGGGPGKCRDARQLQVTWGVFEQMESRSAFVGVSGVIPQEIFLMTLKCMVC